MTVNEVYRKLKLSEFYDTHLICINRGLHGQRYYFGGEVGLMLNSHGKQEVKYYTIEPITNHRANVVIKTIECDGWE